MLNSGISTKIKMNFKIAISNPAANRVWGEARDGSAAFDFNLTI
ncbi:hypothetical protein D1BOALGB6SA_8462 [Olavius sp. associated proteobacterium Delta 1]|nr:hypothetical protein D1BOALGB6SA_8462 [Olavius sp. associated proteobacterium Delta 1]